jgi:hypothetical protein
MRPLQDPIPIVRQAEEDQATILARVNEREKAAVRFTLDHVKAQGEDLLKLKHQAGHGNWMRWAAKNLTLGLRQAEKYMEVAEFKFAPRDEFESLRAVMDFLSKEKENQDDQEAAPPPSHQSNDEPPREPEKSAPSAPAEPSSDPKPESKPAPAVDEWGIPIQPHAAEAFAAVPQFEELLSLIRKAQKLFNQLAREPGGKFLTKADISSYRRGKKTGEGEYVDRFVLEELETALHKVKNSIPAHTACPWNHVDAPHPEKCSTCLDLNWTPPLTKSAEVAKERMQKELIANEE